MFHRYTVLLLMALAPGPALALTADQVWADWQRLATSAGTPLTATTRRDGDRLVLSRLTLAIGISADPSTLRLDRLILRDNPDGTVAVLLPDSFPVTLDAPGPATPPVTFTTSAPGLAITIAGIGPTAAFDITAPSLTVTLPPGTGSATVAVADLTLRHATDFTAPRNTIASTLAIGTLHADFATTDGVDGTVTLDLSAFSAGLDADVLAAVLTRANPVPVDIIRTLSQDVRLTAFLTHGPLSMTVKGSQPDEPPLDVALTAASGEARIGIDAAGVRYAVSSGATRIDAVLNDPTLPVSTVGLGYAQAAFGFSSGVGTDAQPFSAHFRLIDLALDDPLWAAADPATTFPRTPITIDQAISGTYAIKPEALLPGWQPKSEDDVPFDILALSLDTLLLKGLGASLTGTGALTFDPTDLVTFDGVPAPTGTLSFAATGINALIDRAADAGLIPPDDLTGLRLGLAFIAKPGNAPDTLTSKVEFVGKSLLLNGQKLR